MNNKNIKLYNVIFPVWILIVLPITWVIVLPINFIIDSFVILLVMKILKIDNIKQNYKFAIFSVWGFGFISDLIGGLIMALNMFVELPLPYEVTNYIMYNPFKNIYSFLYVTVCTTISAIFIYIFNYKLSFKNTSFNKREKSILSLTLAIFTAPYLFYLPTELFIRY